MGQVIKISAATRVTSEDPAIRFIEEAYTRLAALPGFSRRPGQSELSAQICKALVAGEPIAAEAPTGTGKTVAYLVGAIAASEKLRSSKEIPIVVATATIGLQTQILAGDIPALVAAGIISAGDTVIAKGRSRYFCISNAERVLDESGENNGQFDFFSTEANTAVTATREANNFLEHWSERTWAGDIDSFPGATPLHWDKVAASADTCIGHKCAHYKECPFFNSRRILSTARVIVANHDLVLADLAMAKEGQDPLFPGGHYIVVFDEAHHLPDKALEMGSAKIDLKSGAATLPGVQGLVKAWQRNPEFLKLLDKAKMSPADLDPAYLLNALSAVEEEVQKLAFDEEYQQHRFKKGVLPPNLLNACQQALLHASNLARAFGDSVQALKGSNLAEKLPTLKKGVSDLLAQSAHFGAHIESLRRGFALICLPKRAVRWAYRSETELTLNCAPLEGADVLKDLLWSSERVRTALVSATLRDFSGFDRYAARCGAPITLRTYKIEPHFPYHENLIQLVSMDASPKQIEREAFEVELRDSLPTFIKDNEGSLILFPSRSLMRSVMPALKSRFPGKILCQGDLPIKELVAEHKSRINKGQGSILCGLATLAEGLDLPGEYCTHVLICALPFTVPTSPVEQELQEELGKEYFAKRALPDALVKLVQMVGRLMRRESDRGTITIFDRRLANTQWGRKMLLALPGFRRKVVPSRQLSLTASEPSERT